MSDEEPRVRVVYDDAPVHCIDVLDGLGQRVLRIRPSDGRVSFRFEDSACVSMMCAEAEDLASALQSVASTSRKRMLTRKVEK